MTGDRSRELILQHSRTLAPVATGVSPRLQSLPEVRCVLFDVYGTLMVSGSGEVGTLLLEASVGAFVKAIATAGVEVQEAGNANAAELEERGRTALAAAVTASHAHDRAAGVEYPEVEITDIWRDCLAGLARDALVAVPPTVDFAELALQYELRTNPVWPMPGAERCLSTLRERGVVIGIISNAQFFTPQILTALLPISFKDLDSGGDVQYYSYRHRQAKPGEVLFRMAAEELAERGISAGEILYVGNDMLNDVMPAAGVGFRTALFAGDARSLRLREDDDRIAGVSVDLVIDDLTALIDCVGVADP